MSILHGDALDQLKTLQDNTIDCIVTDPPYALTPEEYSPNKQQKGGFMNKKWDSALVPIDIWKECLRVLKHGAFAFIMCSPRQDVLARQIINLQDAGFKTNFSHITWTFASGFPKAGNVSKMIEKRGINKPELNGAYCGLQMKPALEMILCVMKPLSEKSYVDQALANKHGITWLDSCRIPYQSESDVTKIGFKDAIPFNPRNGWHDHNMKGGEWNVNQSGRFPANLICGSRLTFNIDDLLELQQVLKQNANPKH